MNRDLRNDRRPRSAQIGRGVQARFGLPETFESVRDIFEERRAFARRVVSAGVIVLLLAGGRLVSDAPPQRLELVGAA